MSASIGNFVFVSMDPMPPTPQQQIVLEARAGTAGVSAWTAGVKGQQMSVTTLVDVLNGVVAAALVQSYANLVGAVPQVISYAGLVLPYKVLVTGVKPVEVRNTLLGVGGTAGVSRGICVAQWDLVPWVV